MDEEETVTHYVYSVRDSTVGHGRTRGEPSKEEKEQTKDIVDLGGRYRRQQQVALLFPFYFDFDFIEGH